MHVWESVEVFCRYFCSYSNDIERYQYFVQHIASNIFCNSVNKLNISRYIRLILYVSLVTELLKHDVSWTIKQTLQRLPFYLCEPTIRSMRYNFALTKLLLSLHALRNAVMGPGVKTFLVSRSIYNMCQCLLNS